ncbi:MAG: hypothetical protein QOG54_2799 [Actinomycetota bacterium]|jgi:streptogramin lyase|nr:hypothetical protein [Actinomycetota bacterium]
MNDLEGRLKRTLQEVRDAHHDSIGSDERFEARRSLLRRLQRRRTRRAIGAVAAGVAVVTVAFFFVSRTSPVDRGGPDPSRTLPIASQPLDAIDVGASPSDIAVGGQGNVWTANAGDNSLTRVISSTGEIDQTIQLPGAPGDIAIAAGPVWVALPELGQITSVDFITSQPSPPIQVSTPGVEMELTVGQNVLWIVAKGEAVYRLDSGSTDPQEVPLTAHPIDIAVHDATGYVLDSNGTITTFDQATGAKGATVSGPANARGDLIFAAGGLWNIGLGNVVKIDPASGAEIARYDVIGEVIDLAIDPKVAWVLESTKRGYRLVRIDRNDAAPTGDVITLPGEAVEAGISGGKLWVTDLTGGRVLAFDKLP